MSRGARRRRAAERARERERRQRAARPPAPPPPANTNKTQNRYSVRKKSPKKTLDEIEALLRDDFTDPRTGRTQCGIVYCLSRQECENVAARLNGARQRCGRGLACAHYHAAMPAEERERVQADWQADVVQVIVATIGASAGLSFGCIGFGLGGRLFCCSPRPPAPPPLSLLCAR